MSNPATPPAVSADSYDAMPYSISAFRHTDPNRLAVTAHLFGLASAPPDACRVLELGCASGGNLIPMALAYPRSHCVGIDLSQRQIDDGLSVVRELALPNIELKHLSITDVDASLGKFDYILAHGVYSWVPPAVQDKILDICRDNLMPGGVAYISYNTFPGWHVRTNIREMLLYQTAKIAEPVEKLRQMRAYLAFLTETVQASPSPHNTLLAHELAQLEKHPDTYLMHEYLEDFNEPLYFHQFHARVAKKGLRYLAEAEIAMMLPARFGPGAEATLRAMSADVIELEQNMDFLGDRMFRRTLLCHAEGQGEGRVGQGAAIGHTMRPDAIAAFHIASRLKAESASPDIASEKTEAFIEPERPRLSVRAPIMKAALVSLAESWPLPIPFENLLSQARDLLHGAASGAAADAAGRQLAEGLLNCYAAGVVELTASPPAFVTTVSQRPVASVYARHRARLGPEVTNLRLENLNLTDPARIVLSHLDGTHGKTALATLLLEWMRENMANPPTAERTAGYIDYILPILAKSGLLQG